MEHLNLISHLVLFICTIHSRAPDEGEEVKFSNCKLIVEWERVEVLNENHLVLERRTEGEKDSHLETEDTE